MIYTKKGDDGYTMNAKNISFQKDYVLFELMGTIDELSSVMGAAKTESSFVVREVLTAYQKELISVNGCIASSGNGFDFSEATKRIETLIDTYSPKIPKNEGFSISGETKSGALLDMARTVARRAERAAVKANKVFAIKKEELSYFNRFSDLMYILARYEDGLGSAKAEKVSYSVSSDSGKMNLKKAEEICGAVMAKAREIGVLSVCAVCDGGGNLICLKRDDDAYIASINVAANKAYTSVSLKMPTKKLEELTKPGDPLYGIQHQDSKLVVFGGGIPIYENGIIVGGFGVSGGSLEQDTFLADYADNLFNQK